MSVKEERIISATEMLITKELLYEISNEKLQIVRKHIKSLHSLLLKQCEKNDDLKKDIRKANLDRNSWCKLYSEQLDKTCKLLDKYEPETLEY